MEVEMGKKHIPHDNLNVSAEKPFTEMPHTAEAIRLNLSREENLTKIISHLADVEDSHSNRRLRKLMIYFLLVIFVLAWLATLSLFFFNAFGLTHLSERALIACLCATVAITTRLVSIIVKQLFPEEK
jgi:hypothetical protein